MSAAAPPPPLMSLLADEGRDALECIEMQMRTVAQSAGIEYSDRKFLGLQMLRASSDHGRSMTFLLANYPVDMMASALALHRAQIETFLRGVFFAELASDEELADFLKNDMGPRRLRPDGNPKPIGIKRLARDVEARICLLEGAPTNDGILARMVETAWSPLCGAVHGGVAIHKLYANEEQQIGCSAPPALLFHTTCHAVLMVNFCLSMSFVLAGVNPQRENDSIIKVAERFGQYMDRHNARLRQAGLPEFQRRIRD